MPTYSELLRLPAWQKKRYATLESRGWKCQGCGAKEKALQVHHLNYIDGHKPWDYPDDWLEVLCDECHEWREGFNALFGRTHASTADCKYLVEFFRQRIHLPELAAGKLMAEAARIVAGREEHIANREFEHTLLRNREWDRLSQMHDPLGYAGSWLTESELISFSTFLERKEAAAERYLEGSRNGQKP